MTPFRPVHTHTHRRFEGVCCLHTSLIFRSVMRCTLLDGYKHCGDIWCLYFQSEWRGNQVSSRRCYTYTRRHGFTSQKPVILIFTATITWNPNLHLAVQATDLVQKDDFPYLTVKKKNNPRVQKLLEISVGFVWCPERGQIEDYHHCFSKWQGRRWRGDTSLLKMISWIKYFPLVLPSKNCSVLIFNSAYVGWFWTKS